MKRAGALCLLVLILAACGRGEAEVAAVRETAVVAQQTVVALAATSDAATLAAQPTATAGGEPTATPSEIELTAAALGDPARGQVSFTTQHTTAQGPWMCAQCHSTGTDRLIGPGMAGIAERAATRVEGQSAIDYIRNSILHPNDYIVQGEPAYPSGLMPQNYAEVLPEQELNDLIAYLLTL